MIPAEVANTLRSHLPNATGATQSQQTQPVPAAQRITDVLSNLVPGQRVFADIQAMLPNGTYRAVVAQRDITLALPFSAKAGDSLELEVIETDGKVSLAVVANRGQPEGRGGQQGSVSTSLTSAGKLIGDLMQEIDGEGKRAPAAPLNGNQALVSSMPHDGAQLAPVLKQALTQSGMFYEAHQARWVKGQLPTEQLRQEPQGRIPVAAQGLPNFSNQARPPAGAQPTAQLPPSAATPPPPQPASVFSGLQSLYRALTNQPDNPPKNLQTGTQFTTQAAIPGNQSSTPQVTPQNMPLTNQATSPGFYLPNGQTLSQTGNPQLPPNTQGLPANFNQIAEAFATALMDLPEGQLPTPISNPQTPGAPPSLPPNANQATIPVYDLPDNQTGTQVNMASTPETANSAETLNRTATQSAFAAPRAVAEDGTPIQQSQQSVVRVEAQNTTPAGIPRDLAPLVQQQLDGLANQNFAWQGQIWPGQAMWWEIGENPEDSKRVGEEANARWHTRLKLTLPQLGDIDARIHLQPGGELGIRISAGSTEGETRMREQLASLHQQMETAGLKLRQILIDHEIPSEG